jgi:Leucine-rich repeat (LRR) protein
MNLPDEIERMIVEFLKTDQIIHVRLLSTSFRDATKWHTPSEWAIKGRLRYMKTCFPYATQLKLYHDRWYTEDDFSNLDHVHTLELRNKTCRGIQSHYFRHLKKLTSLNVRCCDITGFNDDTLELLTGLKQLYISNNHRITNKGMSKLVHLTHLYLQNSTFISDYGISTMTKLIDLDLYHVQGITDLSICCFQELQVLRVTFGKVSMKGIRHLKNLKQLSLCGCENFRTTEGMETMPNLTHVSLTYCPIHDEHLQYLTHLKMLSVFGGGIQGNGLRWLTNVSSLSLHKLDLKNEYMNQLCSLPRIQHINIYDCPSIYKETKQQLRIHLPHIFHSEA